MNHEVSRRLKWVQYYEKTGHTGLTCRRCGISRPTLRKWVRRYKAQGLKGLQSRSRKPRSFPARKVFKPDLVFSRPGPLKRVHMLC